MHKYPPEIPEIMTVEFIKEYIHFIDNDIYNERKHICEDDIYFAVIKAIANDKCENYKECCLVVMTVKNMEFDRWYS